MEIKRKSSVSIDGLTRAKGILDQFSEDLTTEKDKVGVIKAFEFNYELSWKLIKKVLLFKGVDVGSPRDAFREAALNGIIEDPTPWFDFLKMRNRTVHTYDLEVLDEIMGMLPVFKKEVSVLIEHLNNNIKQFDLG